MTKFQIALIILAILAVIAVPAVTYLSSTGAFGQAETNHEFSADWSSDADSHWRACIDAGCKETADKTEHAFSDGVVTKPATEEEEGSISYKCLVCGYEKIEAIEKLEHVHQWESEWSSDENQHWHESSCGHDEKDRGNHIYDDGFIEKPATDNETGVIIYTCVHCGYYYEDVLTPTTHTHSYSEDWTFDSEYHWHAAICGHENVKGKAAHVLGDGVVTKEATEDEEGVTSYYCETCDYVKEEPIAKLPHVHVFDENNTCKCGYVHIMCEYCGNCLSDNCSQCATKCAFLETDKLIHFAPSTTLDAPEGPDGLAPGKEGAYIFDESITAQYTVLADGTHATLITLPNGAVAHSGVSLANNKNVDAGGKSGFNCGIPQFAGINKPVRMHFVNNGDSEVTFKYSAIDYYYDKGDVTVTLAPGETKVVTLNCLHTADSVGLNHQIVFPNGAEAGTSISIWGEFVGERMTGIAVNVSPNKLNFGPGETFTADGLVLKAYGFTNDKGLHTYTRVYISNNFTTDLDGYVFTEEDFKAGVKTVTVNFGGFTTTYEITINQHTHNIQYVEATDPIPCEKDGVAAHYICTVDGCGQYFSDAYGNYAITAPKRIGCHTEPTGTILPGAAVSCAVCGVEYGVKSMDNWVLFSVSTQISKIGSNIVNGKLEHADIDGVSGTKVYIGAGTKGATNDSAFYLQMTANDPGYQTVIPNRGTNTPAGKNRLVILFYKNYSDQAVTMNLQNDARGGNGKVTIPANGTAVCAFEVKNTDGSNWFYYYVDSNITTDVVLGVYGYFYVYNEEVDSISVNKTGKTTFKVGDTFSSEGLVINVPITSTILRTAYATTGFTTSLDGYVFTEEDKGKTISVSVTFGDVSCSYDITVE